MLQADSVSSSEEMQEEKRYIQELSQQRNGEERLNFLKNYKASRKREQRRSGFLQLCSSLKLSSRERCRFEGIADDSQMPGSGIRNNSRGTTANAYERET